MAVIYNNTQIIPAPFVTLTTEFERDQHGNKKYERTIARLSGTIVAWKGGLTQGAPPADKFVYEPSGIAHVMTEQNALRTLFSTDDAVLDIIGRQGQTLFSFQAKVTDPLVFDEGKWVQTSTWSVGLSAITDMVGPEAVINERDEWTFAENEDNGVIEVTHSVSAQGVEVDDPTTNPTNATALDFARSWVLRRTGYGTASGNFVPLPSGLDAYNHLRQEAYDIEAGTYSITETWASQSGQDYIEEFEVTRDNDTTEPFETIVVTGTITGLRNDSQTHYSAADNAWSTIEGILFSRATTYGQPSGTLNPNPLTTSLGKNVDDGIFTYTWTYDTRPTPATSGAEEESIIVRDIDPQDVYASIPIIGRSLGPVLQFMSTYTSYSRECSIEIKFEDGLYTTYADKTSIDTLVQNDILNGLGIQPSGTRSVDWLLDSDDSSWDFRRNIYTRDVRWTWNIGI